MISIRVVMYIFDCRGGFSADINAAGGDGAYAVYYSLYALAKAAKTHSAMVDGHGHH